MDPAVQPAAIDSWVPLAALVISSVLAPTVVAVITAVGVLWKKTNTCERERAEERRACDVKCAARDAKHDALEQRCHTLEKENIHQKYALEKLQTEKASLSQVNQLGHKDEKK